jgi:glycosyltransferase EpsF
MKTGNYDVMHCHRPEHAAGLLKIANELKIPTRIVHSRNAVWCRGKKNLLSTLRYLRFRYFIRPLLYRYATHLLAVSSDAGCFAFGNQFMNHPKCSILFNGVMTPHYEVDVIETRRVFLLDQYDLNKDSIVIGNVGSLDIQKNQRFLIRVFKILAERDKRYVLFIAGEGYNRNMLEQEIRNMGLTGRVIMPGVCFNIPELECHLFDVFCLPSLFEGLPNAVLEAISTGLFAVCANTITNDLFSNFPDRTQSLSLNVPLAVWADALEAGIAKRRSPKEGVEIIRQTPFSIENSAENLVRIYEQELKRT